MGGGSGWTIVPEEAHMAGTVRVLAVDDEPQITRVLRTVLTSQGYQVRTTPDGESALSAFGEWISFLHYMLISRKGVSSI